jgi:hypothetical protein
MSELLLNIGPVTFLRFMVDSSMLMQPEKPRLTWQRMANGDVIISAAFECGNDTYNRATSGAVIFLQSKASEITKVLVEAFPNGAGATVSDAVLSKEEDIAEFIANQISLGKSGGEIDNVKKNSEGSIHQFN